MNELSLNRPALLETLAYIEAHPENWDQSTWAMLHPDKDTKTWSPDNICGSSFCFAGRALVDNGWSPYVDMNDSLEGELLIDEGFADVEYFIPTSTAKKLAKHFRKTGEWLEVDGSEQVYALHQAAEILGISQDTAEVLFHGNNSLGAIRRMVADLVVYGELQKGLPEYTNEAYDEDNE